MVSGTVDTRPVACALFPRMNTLFLLMSQYNAAVIPVEFVVRDYFRHLTVENFLRKCLACEIDLPVVRIEPTSQKSAKGIHVNELAAYLDKQTAAARKEHDQLRRAAV
jgi:hypothetical protein